MKDGLGCAGYRSACELPRRPSLAAQPFLAIRITAGIVAAEWNGGSMPDPQLIAWFRSGADGWMASLAEAEKQLTHATAEAVSSPALEHASLIRDAAEAVALAGRGALAWLAENPGSNAAVNVAMKQGWTAYEAAATTMIDMCTGSVSMTPENGELARAAIEVAQRENWEATMAYVKAVGP